MVVDNENTILVYVGIDVGDYLTYGVGYSTVKTLILITGETLHLMRGDDGRLFYYNRNGFITVDEHRERKINMLIK